MLTGNRLEVGNPLTIRVAVDRSQLAAEEVSIEDLVAVGASYRGVSFHTTRGSVPDQLRPRLASIHGRPSPGPPSDAVADPCRSGGRSAVRRLRAVCYEKSRPRLLIHVGIKKFGRIPPGGGHRFVGRQQGLKHNDGHARNGRCCAFLHHALSGFSRLTYSEQLLD